MENLLKALDKKTKHLSFVSRGENGIGDILLKWGPLCSIFALDLAQVKTKNDFRRQLLLGTAAETLLNAIVYPTKKIVHRSRPNHSSNRKSFPSGHTATSFLGAEIIHQELKDSHQLASYGGYAVAAATALLRMSKEKHWLSDVVAGAALGIISAKLIYWWNKKMDG